jgi:polysaccharide biosynthesis protein PslG
LFLLARSRSIGWRAVCALGVLATVTVGVTAVPGSSSAPLDVQSASAATPSVRFGIAYGGRLPYLSSSALAATLDDAVALGATWIRTDLNWNSIQPQSASSSNWQAFDRVVQAANARGLSVLPIIDFPPVWARAASCASQSACEPANPAQYAAFAQAAAARYAPEGVHTWEVWNEPNVTNFWKPAPNVAAYTQLVKATSSAVRATDPTATIISGGLAPAATIPGGNIAPLDFLAAFCKQGGVAAVNAVGMHPYSYPVLPTSVASWNAWSQMASTPISMRSILAGCGQGSKQIWATEYGAPTNGPGALATLANLDLSAHPDHVDEALQAAMATSAVRLAKQSPWLGALFWDTNIDVGTSTATNENFFGLYRADGSAKPAWAALKAAIGS